MIQAKYEKIDNWKTKKVTFAYGISLWRSIRIFGTVIFLERTRFYINNKRKILLWLDNWLGIDSLKQLFLDIYLLNQQQQTVVPKAWATHGWNLTYRRMMQDWEIDRLAEFYGTLDQFGGLE